MIIQDLKSNDTVTADTFDGGDCYDYTAGMLKSGGFGWLSVRETGDGDYAVTVGNKKFADMMEACA